MEVRTYRRQITKMMSWSPPKPEVIITSDITRYLLIFKVNVKVKVKVCWAMPLLADTGKPRWLLKPEVVLTSARFHRLCSCFLYNLHYTQIYCIWQPGGWITIKHNKNKKYIMQQNYKLFNWARLYLIIIKGINQVRSLKSSGSNGTIYYNASLRPTSEKPTRNPRSGNMHSI